MQKMPPVIFTGTVFGLLQSFGLYESMIYIKPLYINGIVIVVFVPDYVIRSLGLFPTETSI